MGQSSRGSTQLKMKVVLLVAAVAWPGSAQIIRDTFESRPIAQTARRPFTRRQQSRTGRTRIFRNGRQEDGAVNGGVDFSGCVEDPETGLCCVDKEETVTTLEKEPILECTHKNTEQCHYTYVTQFKPSQEEVCEENFEKQCSITFKQQAFNETVKKCYTPLIKECNGQGPEECRTVYESSCTTKYIEKQPGKFVGDTACEKLPVEICGAGCVLADGDEECHDKVLTSLVDVPEEVCDLNPQKLCKFVTKLVPSLSPKHECTIVPKETCHLKFTQPKQVDKPLQTRWCLDPTPAAPGESYDEADALGAPLGAASDNFADSLDVPASYGAARRRI